MALSGRGGFLFASGRSIGHVSGVEGRVLVSQDKQIVAIVSQEEEGQFS